MSTEIKVPNLPESVSDATLVAWHKKAGDSVSRDENLADLETDKVVLEVPAPASGTLKELKVEEGTTVEAGDVLAILEEGDGDSEESSDDEGDRESAGKDDGQAAGKDEKKDGKDEKKDGKHETKDSKDEKKDRKKDRDDDDEAPADDETDAEGESADESDGGEDRERSRASAHKLSPSVRRLLDEHDLDPGVVEGSGRDGRITKSDVMAYLKSHRDEDVAPGDAESVPAGGMGERGRNDHRVPMTRLRARIAERMVDAQQTAAMLTTFNEVDLTEVTALRRRYRESFEKEYGVKLGFMSFFCKAAIEALRKFPVVNASVEDNDIVYHDYYDIGIAVSSERGLMVPVLRDVDQQSFADIEKNIAELGKKAREGAISIEELTGGTFTITNGGVFGSLLSTPILNPPQSAILGMHTIQDRPMVVDGEIRIRPMMYVALTYDHRIIDGREAVQFLVTIKQALEDPGRLLLRI